MAQMKEQIKPPEKIQLSNEEIANLSDAQFKTLIIRKLRELVEFGSKLYEKMKAMLRETKENMQETNSDGKETGTQINGVDQKEERNIQPEKNEERRIRKNEERLRNLQDILKCSNIRIIGVPEGEEEEQKIENLFEQIRKENFPHLALPSSESPKEAGLKEEHTKAHCNYITQDETEGENLRSSKRKEDSYLQRSSHKTISWFLKRDLTGKKGLERSIPT